MNVLKLPREQKEVLIDEIKSFCLDERGEEIGNIAAETLLHFFIDQLGPVLYNQGIRDAVKLVGQRCTAMEEDLQSLQRMTRR
ncbi:uncharacterized protein (DUF2164 family) [Melghirimyces profundicolus]|uniref:Uncharacterized protein (DUF2164 family) n=1 Tax=Melghirimyces profundicolus TaxID=1242148 RepID=A0A2T6C4J0_9BACL|nr:DUF2164 domain-containing protein [Melghirimyces profundicolus]PTX63239.1 uncharacterized protein (DUF2164 family) [Melghirimyces profundicolus]